MNPAQANPSRSLVGRLATTTRARLLLLVSAILAPLALFAVVMFAEFASAERARYRTDAEVTAQQLSGVIDRDLAALTAALQTLATSPSLAPGSDMASGDMAAFHQQALQLIKTRGYAVVARDRSGQQLMNTSKAYGTKLPRSTSPPMLAADQAVFSTGKPYISNLFTGITDTSQLVLIDVPISRDGRVVGALDVALEPAYLSAILGHAAQPGWTISLVDRNDRIIASSRQDPAFVGREATEDLRRAATDTVGTWSGTTLDGTEVLGAYARSPVSGWRVAVGVPTGTIEAPLRRLTIIVFGSGLLVSLLALFMALEVARTINRPIALLTVAADRLGRGENVPRLQTGLSEVDDVAGALSSAEEIVSIREAALQASEERFRAAVRAMDGVIWTNDAAGQMSGDQPSWAMLTGQSYEEYQGFGWAEAVHPDDAVATVAAWDDAVRGRKTFVFEHRVRRRDGVYRRFSIRAVPIIDAAGEISEWVGVHTDITEEAAAKATLAAREAELRDLNATLERRVEETSAERDRIWRISTELMMVARFDGTILAVNPAWGQTLRWSEHDLLSKSFMDLVHPDDLAGTKDQVQAMLAGHAVPRFQNRFRHRDGSHRWLSWAAVPEVGLIHAIARDVTTEKEAEEALRRAEEQLRQSQKMEVVGQLTGGIAHDFNNLLTVVSGNLEMARRRVERQGENPRLIRYLTSALEGAQRAAVLTHRLLAFARQTPLRPDLVDLNAVIGGMSDLIGRTLGEPIRIETRYDAQLWSVEADRNQIENAVLNLCVNARDAMPKGGVLTLETGNKDVDGSCAAVARGELPPGQYAMLAVSDTGGGISPEIQQRVFEPFFTTKPIGKGTGLGLSQVFGFMRQSGGLALLESIPGQGTTVRLLFPRMTSMPERARPEGNAEQQVERQLERQLERQVGRQVEPGAETNPQAAGGGEMILVVEDEEMVREFTVAALEEAGFRVVSAHDGPSGLRLLDEHPDVALLFTDMVLAGPIDGRAVADEARRRRADLPLLFTTGYTPDAVTLEGRSDPGVEIITKPFNAAMLVAKVRAVLGPSLSA